VTAGGRRIRTAFTATVSDLLERRELPMRLCETDRLWPATVDSPVRVVVTGSAAAEPTRLALLPGSGGATAAPVDSVLSIDRWDKARRRVTLAPWATERILVLRENTNPGWRARIAGRTLRPIVVDGWQQGWIVPAGSSGTVKIVFAPDRVYRAGLAAGAVLAGVVVLAALPIGRAAPTPVGPRRPRRRRRDWPLVVLGAVFLVVAGGYAAAALALLGVLGLLALSRVASVERRRAERWAPVVLFAAACLLSLRAVLPHAAAGPQLAGLAAFAALWLGTLPFARGPSTSAGPGPADSAGPVSPSRAGDAGV
jgi:arabinofuranan 3-O-arabinosyltransferase